MGIHWEDPEIVKMCSGQFWSQSDLKWHNRGCVNLHEIEPVIWEMKAWGSGNDFWPLNCAKWSLMTQPRLCQLAWFWPSGMPELILWLWERLLDNPSCKIPTFDTTAIVSICKKLKKLYARIDLQGLYKWFGTPNMKNGHFWHNRGCVKFHQNDEISLAPAWTSLLEFRYELPSQMEFIWSIKKSISIHKIVYDTI